jgi:hypothetical protein
MKKLPPGETGWRRKGRWSNMIRIGSHSLASRLLSVSVLSGCLAPQAAVPAPAFSAEAICRAAIASITGRDPRIMRITRINGDTLFLSYLRPIDNFIWDYRCRIEGNRVIWASEPGRWREGPKDDKVSFEIIGDGEQLRIIDDHADGSSTNELFDRDSIR